MNTINNKIVQAALADEGKEEIKGNHGWVDKDFDLQMKLTGWQDGQAWCAYWAEKIWTQVYDEPTGKILRRLFSANAVHTFNSFWDSTFVTSNEPVEGAVVIWQKVKDGQPCFVGESQWITGHAGIVINTEGDANEFTTLEGNSNSEGGREGIEVARQVRKLDFETQNGLQLLGFIHPKETI
jgi:hypothetical protein